MAASSVPAGSVLGANEWLSSDHILRDYGLLQEELQRIAPAFAASIRLVDPLVSALLSLRRSDQRTLERSLGSIYAQTNGPANFLFLPVNDGVHWSLLLVDRRNPREPVAYHYDSRQERGYNDGAATRLAARLGAPLAPGRMAQQKNDFDCGVFVVEGTRALVNYCGSSGRWTSATSSPIGSNSNSG
ncbi:hypothetical protein [Sinorhizobium psoraleae]|uniref:hypothetical protein n=1 Tax=Sinorhizobium psoraleae TaxID=520838 RepID=UPI0015690553|nr:hypothetical protein [Sinorhizobium psoraleae]